ncbi:primosomal protein N' [Herbiconiux sp. L3-i23]|uniref:primosomal protein N' family DNA-binding protein n=1 Tax=Herbiconiux sp. L3-i23 TaxID=2905871 RepID=UPI00205FD540|nr:primosomal protein N' [Herbiconiux sp. L3-i23]BDI22773.1 putative primosomal protein N' [Herbiconiux sp. L3-i23]
MAAAEPHRVARVIIDSPLPQLDHLFDYRIPDALVGRVVQGVRVRVPLRVARRIADAYVVETAVSSEVPGELSEIEELVSEISVLRREVFDLTRAAADRAAGGASDIIRLAVPRRHVRVEKAWLAREQAEPLALPQARAVDGYAADQLGGSRLAVAAPVGVVEVGGRFIGAWALTLAQLAVRALADGRSALLAVPDYRDQDQLEIALAALVDERFVLRLDAKQTPASRYRAFLDTLVPEPRIVIGNRSVVYAPAHDPGLIAFWNDGDALFAEPLAPYVHARDAALIRQEQSGAALVFLSHTPSSQVERLVRLGWLTRVAPLRARGPRVVLTPDDPTSPRIPPSAWKAASEALATGPVLIQVARPGSASLEARERGEAMAADAGGTAHDLARAFPRVKVLLADGDHPVERVGSEPLLVIATRGAEPIADGGYHAVLLLDGGRMLARESLRVAEDCLRWWSAAATLAAAGAPVHLVGIGGELGIAMATWRQDDFLAREVAERKQLRLPPAVRLASVSGASRLVAEAVAAAERVGASVLSTEPLDAPGSGAVRTLMRFDYGHGHDVASALRTAVVAAASGRRRPATDERGYRPAPTLRVRMDDVDAL